MIKKILYRLSCGLVSSEINELVILEKKILRFNDIQAEKYLERNKILTFY